jgi:hypothetical protein
LNGKEVHCSITSQHWHSLAFMTQMACIFALLSHHCNCNNIYCTVAVKFPHQSSHIKNLRSANIYMPVLRLLQIQYLRENIVSDSGASKTGIMFQSRHVKSYATANVCGIKYGAFTHHRGKKSCYAYIQDRSAVQIVYILCISIPNGNMPINLNVALIRRFQAVCNPPIMPWSLWCVI